MFQCCKPNQRTNARQTREGKNAVEKATKYMISEENKANSEIERGKQSSNLD